MPLTSPETTFRNLPPALREAILSVAQAIAAYPSNPFGQKPRALLVGGLVRDLLSGDATGKDADMECAGIAPEALAELLAKTLPDTTISDAGVSFGILIASLPDGTRMDIALPRTENKISPGHRGFDVETNPQLAFDAAARRRDFTINAMGFDPLTGDVLDPFDGQADLETHVLRVVDAQTFQDDPLRVWRALQFVARFHLSIEKKSLALLKKMVKDGSLDELPPERVTEELRKLLLSPKPSLGLELADELGLVDLYLPELAALKKTEQNPEWHPEGNVWIHTLMVVDEAAKLRRDGRTLEPGEDIQIMLGALCHDLGKPGTTKEIDGRLRSHGHEEAGDAPTRSFLDRFSVRKKDVDAIVGVVREHLKPRILFKTKEHGELDDAAYANAVRKLLKRIAPASWRVLIAVAQADVRGRGNAAEASFDAEHHMQDVILHGELDVQAVTPLLQGRDLIKLGVKPGPDIGRLLGQVEALRDDGTITNRAQALQAAERLLLERE